MKQIGYTAGGGTSWQAAVVAAKTAGKSLTALGHYNGIEFQPKGNAYAVYGTCISEVMVDVLTGEVRFEKVDILMDLGTQLNAAVDIGQVQGAFVKVLGYLFTEE